MNGEKGQALPMAILALVIGALLIAPFLGNASSSLIGSRVYGDTIGQQSTSDAGVEHAIWSLTRGSLAGQFSGPGDTVTYQLGEALNGVTATVTVTANATSQNGTLGEIADAVIDSLIFESTNSYLPSLIMVSSNVCAVAYRGASNRGNVKTMSISAGGAIGNSVIDTLIFDTTACYEPSLIQISDNMCAVAYRGASNRGNVKTVSVAANGVIGNSVTDTLQFDTSACYEPSIILVSGSVYAVAYRGPSSRGYLKTMTIAANGDIGAAAIDTLIFDTTACSTPRIIKVSGNTYAVAYRGPSNQGYLKTMSITTAGDIGASAIDTLVFDTSTGYEPDIVQVSGTTYAIAYRGGGNRGYLKTMTISASGDIGAPVIDTLQFDVTSYEPYILFVSGEIFAVAYRGPSNHGYLKTISISAGGVIGASVIDTLQFDAVTCYEPVAVSVTGGIFAIAYRGSSNDGFLITVGITQSAAVAALYEIVSTAGDSTIRAYVNTANTTATIISWLIE